MTQNTDIALETCYGRWHGTVAQGLMGHEEWILSKLTSRKRVWDKANRKVKGRSLQIKNAK